MMTLPPTPQSAKKAKAGASKEVKEKVGERRVRGHACVVWN